MCASGWRHCCRRCSADRAEAIALPAVACTAVAANYRRAVPAAEIAAAELREAIGAYVIAVGRPAKAAAVFTVDRSLRGALCGLPVPAILPGLVEADQARLEVVAHVAAAALCCRQWSPGNVETRAAVQVQRHGEIYGFRTGITPPRYPKDNESNRRANSQEAPPNHAHQDNRGPTDCPARRSRLQKVP